MKKFLVLTLVLGMAAMANATLIMTSTYDGSDLVAGDTFTIDITTDAMMMPVTNEVLAVVVSDSTVADIYGGTAATSSDLLTCSCPLTSENPMIYALLSAKTSAILRLKGSMPSSPFRKLTVCRRFSTG